MQPHSCHRECSPSSLWPLTLSLCLSCHLVCLSSRLVIISHPSTRVGSPPSVSRILGELIFHLICRVLFTLRFLVSVMNNNRWMRTRIVLLDSSHWWPISLLDPPVEWQRSTYRVQSTMLCSQPLEVPFAQIELSSLLLSLPSTERECKLVMPVTKGQNYFCVRFSKRWRPHRVKTPTVSLAKEAPSLEEDQFVWN